MLLTAERRDAVAKMDLAAVNGRRKEVTVALAALDKLPEADFTAKQDEFLMLHEERELLTARHDSLMAVAEARGRFRQDMAAAGGADAAVAQMNGGEPRIGRIRDGFLDDPMRGFESRQDFLVQVRDMSLQQGRQAQGPDPRLRSLLSSGLGTRGDKPIMAVGSDEFATFNEQNVGFFIPKTMLPDVYQIDAVDDLTGGRSRMIPMTTPVVELIARVDKNHTNSVTGGLFVTRRAEANTGQAALADFEKVKLEAKSLFGLAYMTEEVIEDASISFISLIGQMFPQEFASRVTYERLHGNVGSGELEGAFNTPCKITVTAESGQGANTIVGENILKMRSRCWGYNNAVWVANHDTFPQLYKLYIAAGSTGVITFYNTSLKEDGTGMLLGRPIIFTEYANALGTEGDISLINWNEYLEGVYKPLQSASSIHVRFEQHERVFKFWMRNAGRWWWRTALTPKKGGNTLSPVVTLNSTRT